MFGFALRRSVVAVLALVAVSVITFSLLYLSGDPAVEMAGEAATEEDLEYVRKHYGFDRPFIVQYGNWVANVLRGDLGRSIFLKNTPIAELIAGRAKVTMTLGVFALGFALLLSIPLGVLAAMHPNTVIDRVALTIAVFGQAMPSFWFSLILIYVFSLGLGWLPSAGNSSWRHFVMPSIALGYHAVPAVMRLTRTGMMEVMASDYIRTARAKGLRAGAILFKHALRNAIIPVVSLSAVQLGFMLGGSIVIESVFTLNGLGRLAWLSIQRSDFFVLQAIVLTIAVFYIVATYLADLLNAYLDPRIRLH